MSRLSLRHPTTRRRVRLATLSVALLLAPLAGCSKEEAAPTGPTGPTTGRLVVSIDQNSCAGVITGAPLAEVFINGVGRGRFTLLLDAVRAYDLAPGNYNVSTRINDATIGTPRSVRINAGEDTSFLFFCL
ncbi:MAG: hypothetical protein MUD17_10070 [Gemmatimonadaceae bacterium]|jgi:hypothetical protein|nr:hypothetical protein [Gemmatimonadaceae bacterium]